MLKLFGGHAGSVAGLYDYRIVLAYSIEDIK